MTKHFKKILLGVSVTAVNLSLLNYFDASNKIIFFFGGLTVLIINYIMED